MFDRFWRADPARTQGGTGLGLPISREDAVLHGGSLQAWGRAGEGSEFVLTLPRSVPPIDEQKDGVGGPAPVVPSVLDDCLPCSWLCFVTRRIDPSGFGR